MKIFLQARGSYDTLLNLSKWSEQNDIERIGLNLNYDNTSIDTGSTPASQILAFTQSEGTKFEVFKTQFIW